MDFDSLKHFDLCPACNHPLLRYEGSDHPRHPYRVLHIPFLERQKMLRVDDLQSPSPWGPRYKPFEVCRQCYKDANGDTDELVKRIKRNAVALEQRVRKLRWLLNDLGEK